VLPRILLILFLINGAPAIAAKGTYSRSAKSIGLRCEHRRCPPISVPSPDGSVAVRRTFEWDNKNRLNVPDLELETSHGSWPLLLDGEWMNDLDVFWSPDSKFLALTGSLNGYTESLRVFAVTESGPGQLNILGQPTSDMLLRFPPCRASHIGSSVCRRQLVDPFFNFAAIAWSDSHTLVVMSEVPCGSLWGGIMCQVMGYEVELPSGTIVNSMEAPEFKRRWQNEMPWKFEIPDPPEWEN
jgi:hypothetical protein